MDWRGNKVIVPFLSTEILPFLSYMQLSEEAIISGIATAIKNCAFDYDRIFSAGWGTSTLLCASEGVPRTLILYSI